MSVIADKIIELLRQENLPPAEVKSVLREAVARAWPDLPPWTTLPDGAVIEEVQKAAVGSGVALTFLDDDGVRKLVLAQAGEHYRRPDGTLETSYMIAGGFINLTATPGSSLVPASSAPESPRTGAAREIEEELRMPEGAPLLSIDPARLQPMDMQTLALRGGERRLVQGLMLELTPDEVALVKAHVARLSGDGAYRQAVVAQSLNHDSGRPEIANVAILPLDAAAQGQCPLLHPDQQSLFQAIACYFAHIAALARKSTPGETGPPPAPA